MPDFYRRTVPRKSISNREVIAIAAFAAAVVCACGGAVAQTSAVAKEDVVYNRPVLLVANDKLEVAVVKQGGSMLRLRIQGDPQGLSPFGNPEMMPQIPERRKLQGPMVGHFVCVDGFGSPSAEEKAAGMAMHGEAYLQPWKLVTAEKQGATTTVKFAVDLPKVQEAFTRSLRMVDGESVIYVDSELESELAFDRTINWGEHPFLFPPFLEAVNTVVDMSGTRSQTRTYPGRSGGRGMTFAQGKDFTWPMAPGSDGKLVDLRAAPPNVNLSSHTTTLMDPSRKTAFVTVLNTARHYLLGYVFRQQEYPWVQNFMSYNTDGWLGRGLEFATQPFDLPRREMADLNRMFDTRVNRWLPAKSKITTHFLMFYVRSPEGMTRVDDVRLENGKIVVEDRTSGKTLTLAASLPL
ncbi:MAG: hypothetical protein ABJC09_14835 [Terriglobia bacterium]